jgi:hypothetical protein
MSELLSKDSLDDILAVINTEEGMQWYKQRMFYRSTTAFQRCLQLFLSFLTLDRHCYRTWAHVSAYYSRFFFIQAFLNLSGCTWPSVPVRLKKNVSVIIYYDGSKLRSVEVNRSLSKAFKMGSHEFWWSLMESVKTPDYPLEHLSFVLSRLLFNPNARNNENYSFEYLTGGFNELDWFDAGASQMLNHFMPRPRPDADITDIDRFFGESDPGEADPGDFYGDEAQILWCSLVTYLQFVKSLQIDQSFVKAETIIALCDLHIGSEYPHLIQGIAEVVHATLQDGFDLPTFLEHYRNSPVPEPLTIRWRMNQGAIFPNWQS